MSERPAMPIKSRLPDDLNTAYEQAYAYAVELEQVWAPKVMAYMDELEATIMRLCMAMDSVLVYHEDDEEFCDNLQKDIDAILEDTHE